MIFSIFYCVPRDRWDEVKTVFDRAAAEIGDVPIVVANDGDVSALAGAMGMGVGSIMGMAMDTSEAVGYVYKDIGIYLACTVVQYCQLYDIHRLMLLGRVMSGKGGDLIISTCKEVLADEFPALAAKVNVMLPDEKTAVSVRVPPQPAYPGFANEIKHQKQPKCQTFRDSTESREVSFYVNSCGSAKLE